MALEPLTRPRPSDNGDQQALLKEYQRIRADYLARMQTNTVAPPITDAHGFTWKQGIPLTERWAGFDKVFWTLIAGVVTDPDYALRKDPKVYMRMLRDPQIYYCLEVRKAATTGLPWVVRPPDDFMNDPQALEFANAAERRLKKISNISEMFSNLMDALLPGMAVVELVWGLDPDSGEYVVKEHFPVWKDRFVFDKDGNLRLKTRNSPVTGEPVPSYKFIHHIFNVSDGSWLRPEEMGYCYFGKGLADTPLYHYFYFKVVTLRYLLKALEQYGLPFKLLYTGPQNALLAQRMADIMAALQNDSVVQVPGKKGEVNVDVVKSTGSVDFFISFIEYIDRLITRAILGQELMTEMPDVGSYAAARVHRSVFMQIVESDKNQLEDTINKTLMKYDADLNTPQLPEKVRPRFLFKSAPSTDAAAFLQVVNAAINLGLEVSEAQIREATGLREPFPGEATVSQQKIQMMQMMMAGGGQPNNASTEQEGTAQSKVHKNARR